MMKFELVLFTVLNDGLVWIEDPRRSHFTWMSEDYGISKKEFKESVRGFIKKDRIIVFCGAHLSKVDSVATFCRTLYLVCEYLDSIKAGGVYTVFNGVVMGDDGVRWDTSDPIEDSLWS